MSGVDGDGGDNCFGGVAAAREPTSRNRYTRLPFSMPTQTNFFGRQLFFRRVLAGVLF